MNSERLAVGDLLDNLGVRFTLAPEDLVTDVVVLAKVAEPDGSVSLIVERSESMSWIDVVGMLHAAQIIEDSNYVARYMG